MVGDSDAIQGDDRVFGTAFCGVGFSVFRGTHNSRPSYAIRTHALGASIGSLDDSRVAEPLEPDEPRRTAAAAHTLVAVVAAGVAVQVVEVGVVFGKQATGAHTVQTSNNRLALFGRAASLQDLTGQSATCVSVGCLL